MTKDKLRAVLGHDPRLDMGRAALIAQLDEAHAEIEKRHQVIEGQGRSMENMMRELRDMSSSDSRMFEALVERVEALERKVAALADLAEGKDLSGELYGAEADHTADRAERAEIMRRAPVEAGMPGSARPRPPGGGR